MAPLEQLEKDELTIEVLQELSQTAYACSSLSELTGGTANFVFRGSLTNPISSQDSTSVKRTVVIKHSLEFVAGNRNFPLDVSRCVYEASMLQALECAQFVSIARTPKLYLFHQETNTVVMEDFSGTVDLKSLIVSQNASHALTQPVANSIGHSIGSWLRSFHDRYSAPADSEFRGVVGNNDPMRRLKYMITYDSFIKTLENFPEILEGNRDLLEEVKDMATKEFEKSTNGEGDLDWGIIHGDFWAGNVLVPETLPFGEENAKGAELCIIDWELAQFGHRAYDLGQMIGDLYERKHFNDVDSAMWAIQGFVNGYGSLSDALAFRTAIHTGVHLLGWYIRRAPTHPVKGTPEQITSAARLGMDFILKGWEKDIRWCETSVLACLFRKN